MKKLLECKTVRSNGIDEMMRIELLKIKFFGGLDVCERLEILLTFHSGESTFRSLYYV